MSVVGLKALCRSLEISHPFFGHSETAGQDRPSSWSKGLSGEGLGVSAESTGKPPTPPQASYHGLSICYSTIFDTKDAGDLCPHLPCICQTIFYQTCKPSGTLWALNFYEISGPVIVRQTEELVTNFSPLADAEASRLDAWFPRGRPSSRAGEIDEDGPSPGETDTPKQRGQALSPRKPLPHPSCPEGWHKAVLPAWPDSSDSSVEGKPCITRGCHRVAQCPDSVTWLIHKVDGRASPWQAVLHKESPLCLSPPNRGQG